MDIRCSQEERFLINKVANAAQEAGMEAYLIGGFVRDKILDRPCADMDVVCLGDGIQLAELVAARFTPRPHVSFFKTFGTAHIRVHDYDIEFVGARKESYRHHSRNPEVEPGSLKDDLERRDFTVNAMSVSLNTGDFGKLFDPFNGLSDLTDRIIRTPLSPDKAFTDDPLRMLRAIRFSAQLGFTIDPVTWEGILKNRDRIRIISQ
jgi:tRNA nucleotidyltransferase/poly(A) polymerase